MGVSVVSCRWLSLCRFGRDRDGTWGRLFVPGLGTFFTVEKPWNFNLPFESCIPDGRYLLEYHNSEDKPFSWAMVGGTVSRQQDQWHARYSCLLHIANRPSEVVGCVGVGTQIGLLDGAQAVLDSTSAMRRLDQHLRSLQFPRIQIYSTL